jgi:hypothetical protein
MTDAALRNYLSELTPQARAMLLDQFERRVADGDEEAKTSAILRALRGLAADDPLNEQPLSEPALLFFRPLEPFLIDDRPDRRHPGRLARCVLGPLWRWLARDLLPEAVDDYLVQCSAALEDGEVGAAEALARALQDRTAVAIRSAFAAAENDEGAERALLAQIGTQFAANDAASLRWLLRGRDALARLDAALPERIDDLGAEELEPIIALIDSAARPREIFPFALVTVMNRLNRPTQLVRLAVHVAGSRSASRVAETEYGLSITILLRELERLTEELGTAVYDSEGVRAAALLKHIDTALNGLQAEMQIPVASSLGRQLATLSETAAALGRSALRRVEHARVRA